MSEDGEVEEDSSFSRWGWLATIYELCGDNIFNIDRVTEMALVEVMNWLSYHKEKTDMINSQQKKK